MRLKTVCFIQIEKRIKQRFCRVWRSSRTTRSVVGQLILASWLLTTFLLYVGDATLFVWPRVVFFLDFAWRLLESLR